MKKAIITGANGFVGSNLVEELLKRGYVVYAVIRSQKSDTGRIPKNENVHLVYCDLKGINSLPDLLGDENIDCFFHLAWEGTSGAERGDYGLQLNNVKYSCDAAKAAKKLKCSKFIFAGSIMEYEAMQYLAQSDARPGRGYFYSISKLAADYMSKVEAVNSGIEYINCLVSNIYGAGEISERFVNTTIRKMLKGESLRFSSGEQSYDFIYVTDAVKALAVIAEKGKANSEYYIGSNKIRKLKEYIILMRDIIAPEATLHLGAFDYNGPFLDYSNIDVDKLYRELNFELEVPFETGIKLTRDWIGKNDGMEV